MLSDNNNRGVPHSEGSLVRRRWSIILTWIVMGIALLVIAGWQFNIDLLKSPISNLNAMNPTTAVAFILAGLSYLLLNSRHKTIAKRNVGKILAIGLLVIGFIRVVDSSSTFSIPIDQFLYVTQLVDAGTGEVVRMASNSAFNFVLLAIALLTLHKDTQRIKMPAQFISIIILIAALLSILTYIYRAQALNGIIAKIPMAPHSAICFLLMASAILITHSNKGLMKELTGPYNGSVMARYLFPLAIIVPAALGYLRLMAGWLGLMSVEFGVTILVLTIIVSFLVATWSIVVLLNRRDMLRQNAEKLIRQQEALVQSVFQSSPYALVTVSSDGLITLVNSQCENIFGYKQNELIGQPIEILIPDRFKNSHPDKRKLFFSNPKSRPMGIGLELFARRKDGTEFPVEISLSPVETSKSGLVSATIQDISERKKAEEQIAHLAGLVENTNEAVYSLTTDFRIRSWNKGAEILYGFTSSEAIGKPVFEIVRSQMPVDQRLSIREKIVREGHWQGELEHLTRDGSPISVLASTTATRNGAGEIEGYVSISKDITDRRKAEDALNRLNAQLEERVAERSKELAKSEAFNRGVINALSAHIAVIDVQGGIVAVNEAWERFALENGESTLVRTGVGSNYRDVCLKSAEQGDLSAMTAWDGVKEVILKQRTLFEMEYPCHAPHQQRWFSMRVTNFSNDQSMAVITHQDITPRKEAEVKIKESESRFRLLYENSGEGILLTNADGIILAANPAACALFGWSEAEICKLGRDGLVDMSDPRIAAGLEERRKTGRMNGEWTFIKKNGTKFMGDNTSTMFTNAQGEKRASVFIRDVTERKKAEQQLMDSEARLADAQEVAKVGSWETNLLTQEVFWSKETYRIFELSPNDFNPLHPAFLDLVHPEDRVIVDNAFEESFNSSSICSVKHRILTPSGEIKFVEERWRMVCDETGQPVRATGTCQDITERKKNEQQREFDSQNLNALINNTNDLMWSVDRDFKLITSNKPFDEMSKVSFGKEIHKGDDVLSVAYSPEMATRFKTLYERAFAGESFIAVEHFDFPRKSWTEISYNPIRQGDQIIGTACHSRDITERMKAEKEIRMLNETLEKKVEARTAQWQMANEELEAFSYSVSHDLRAPLRSIDGYAHILVEDYGHKLDDDGKRIIDTITRNAARMGRLIDGMLNLSKLGRLDVSMATLNMGDIVNKIIQEFTETDKQCQAQFRLKPLRNVRADLDMIIQVWTNYISNAIKYASKKAEPIIEIGSYTESNKVVYYVQDNGSGFDNQYAHKLFGVFQRLHKQAEFEGTGVGLAVVKRIVQKHKGQVWADGKPGAGATFYFSLPTEIQSL
jgi:PAS domain S-box-containing protein